MIVKSGRRRARRQPRGPAWRDGERRGHAGATAIAHQALGARCQARPRRRTSIQAQRRATTTAVRTLSPSRETRTPTDEQRERRSRKRTRPAREPAQPRRASGRLDAARRRLTKGSTRTATSTAGRRGRRRARPTATVAPAVSRPLPGARVTFVRHGCTDLDRRHRRLPLQAPGLRLPLRRDLRRHPVGVGLRPARRRAQGEHQAPVVAVDGHRPRRRRRPRLLGHPAAPDLGGLGPRRRRSPTR